jgi:hypothetical protein
MIWFCLRSVLLCNGSRFFARQPCICRVSYSIIAAFQIGTTDILSIHLQSAHLFPSTLRTSSGKPLKLCPRLTVIWDFRGNVDAGERYIFGGNGEFTIWCRRRHPLDLHMKCVGTRAGGLVYKTKLLLRRRGQHRCLTNKLASRLPKVLW